MSERGQVPDEEIIPVYVSLREVGRFAGTVERVHRDEAARAPWREVYPQLSEGSPGLVAAITNRVEAQVAHLSLDVRPGGHVKNGVSRNSKGSQCPMGPL